MRLYLISPSLFFFLAGVAASAGVNLLIDLATDTRGQLSNLALLASGMMWLLASSLLTIAGTTLEGARQEMDRLSTQSLTADEYNDVRQKNFDNISGRLWMFCAIAVALAVFATVILSIR